MAKLLDMLKNRLPTQRRLIQLYAALLYNAYAKGFITGNIYTGALKTLCVPGLNCYSCPGAVASCPLGALQNAIASSKSRAPAYVLGILLLYGILLGRTICGWLCPVGLVQELLHKIPTPKLKKSRWTRRLSWLKYIILAVFVAAIPLWYAQQRFPLPAFCKYICPAGTLEGAVGLLSHPNNSGLFSMLGGLFAWKFILALALAAACVFIYRAFCRFLCPLGAIYSLFSRVALVGVRVEPTRCSGCGKCVRSCKMDVKRVGDHECIHCGACAAGCPTNAICMKAGKAVLFGGEKKAEKKPLRSAAAWALALLLLFGVVWYVNRSEPASVPPENDGVTETGPVPGESAPGENMPGENALEGNIAADVGVGMTAPDFTIQQLGRESFTLSEHRGKVVVVNFWATWCAPCCEELPYFDELHRSLEDVAVIAIHSELVTDDVEGYLAGFDYLMPFAVDEDGAVAELLDISAMLPHTIIIDPQGQITYHSAGSLDAEELAALVAEARSSMNDTALNR